MEMKRKLVLRKTYISKTNNVKLKKGKMYNIGFSHEINRKEFIIFDIKHYSGYRRKTLKDETAFLFELSSLKLGLYHQDFAN